VRDRTRDVRVDTHESEGHAWTFARSAPDARLREWVAGPYGGFVERASTVVVRREVPVLFVPVILNLGDAFRVGPATDALESVGSFAGGLCGRHVVVESARTSECIQVNLTPLGARRIFACPMDDLRDRVVALDDILGADSERLLDRLAGLDGWPARFDLLDEFLLARLVATPEVRPDVVWALARLERADCRIADLARDMGRSPKRLIELFRDQVGLAPKLIARIHRFTRAMKTLGGDDAPSLVESALAAGYYDQAHLNRDFREFAGCTPTEFLRRRLPGGVGLAEV
jgi:AraC-like DNA-binding protein